MAALLSYRHSRSFTAPATGTNTFHPLPDETIYIKRIRVYAFGFGYAYWPLIPTMGWISCQKNGASMGEQPFIAVAWIGGGKHPDDTMNLIPDCFELGPEETLLEEWSFGSSVAVPRSNGQGGFSTDTFYTNGVTLQMVVEVNYAMSP